MKKVGMIFAMQEELEEMKNRLELVKEHKIYELTIYECKYESVQCFLVEAGIGKVNSARTTQILISSMEPDYIFNVGVAGSVAKDVKKCDIVIGDKLVQHDFDLTSFGREKGELPTLGKYIYCDNTLLKTAKETKLENSNIFFGTIASGDIFIDSKEMGRKIHEKFDALCVEMEGASIAQVSYLCSVPFLVIRAISDSPYEENNEITFDEFLKQSSETVSKFVLELLKKV
ncbi:MAG: 5'-methylthioadenosine/adenosylhomocysteine nucleosidase [Clostridia bacterium]|nr:5'-methylthioadenosine/adenosylhomocysteine nucleosidase [Clostridia bacterium]